MDTCPYSYYTIEQEKNIPKSLKQLNLYSTSDNVYIQRNSMEIMNVNITMYKWAAWRIVLFQLRINRSIVVRIQWTLSRLNSLVHSGRVDSIKPVESKFSRAVLIYGYFSSCYYFISYTYYAIYNWFQMKLIMTRYWFRFRSSMFCYAIPIPNGNRILNRFHESHIDRGCRKFIELVARAFHVENSTHVHRTER